jgi:hypothetical protein
MNVLHTGFRLVRHSSVVSQSKVAASSPRPPRGMPPMKPPPPVIHGSNSIRAAVSVFFRET